VIYTTYRIAVIPITLSDLEGHSAIASLFNWEYVILLCGTCARCGVVLKIIYVSDQNMMVAYC